MKQQYIDKLLQSSDDQQYGKKKKSNPKLNKKQTSKHDQNYDDDFFQSYAHSEKDKKKPTTKPSAQSKKQIQLNKFQEKFKPQAQKQPSELDEQKYMNSQDFESVVYEGDQKIQQSTKRQPPKKKDQQEDNQDDYQMDQEFEQEIAQSHGVKFQAQSSDLVQSEYQQSRAKAEQDIEQITDNVDEEIETVKSSKIRSRILNDDDLPQDQSEYIESTRINQQQFKKKPQANSKQVGKNTKINNEKNIAGTTGIGSSKQIDMKKKKPQPSQPLSAKKQASRKDTIPSKKSIPQPRKPSENSTIQIKQPKKIQAQPKPAKPLNPGQKPPKTQEQIQAQIQQRKGKIAQIQAEKKALYQKRTAKQREQQQKAKQEYEEMKKKEEERKEQNRKILQERKKKQKEEGLSGTLPRDNKKVALQKEQLQLTESKIKELAQEQEKKKNAKSEMKNAIEMKKKRKQQEEQVRSKLEKQNKQKLRRLEEQKQGYMDKTYQQKKEYQEKRQQAMNQKKQQFKIKQNQKMNEKKEQQTPEVRKIKQQILALKQKMTEKQESIQSLDDIVKQLKKELKQKELIKFNNGEEQEIKLLKQKGSNSHDMGLLGLGQSYLESQLTAVQKFVRLFDECDTPGQIFNMIDVDGDKFVSLEEVRNKVTEILLNKQNNLSESQQFSAEQFQMRQSSLRQNNRLSSLIEQVFIILDKNSDGNITQQQFSFIIQSQLKKAKQFRRLTNNLAFTNPIDIQASILDMKEKIKYMQKKCLSQLSDGKLYQLEEKYQKYLLKHEQYEKGYIYGTSGKSAKGTQTKKQKLKDQKQQAALQQDLNNDKHYFLTQEVTKLRLKKQNQQKMLQKIRAKQQENIKQKNLQLTQKVQQNIKLNQEIYKLNQQIEQYQLRFLSKTKIQENRYRYMAKNSQQKQLYEEAIQRAKQYQTKILNPTKEIKFGTYANQVKYLAAVIMIQRNFRKRKAIREKHKLQRGE